MPTLCLNTSSECIYLLRTVLLEFLLVILMGIHIIVSRLFLMAFSEKRRGLCATAEGAAENEDGNTFNLQILREKKKSIFSDYMTKEVNHTVLLCRLLQWGWV